jgi:hypothetical protein
VNIQKKPLYIQYLAADLGSRVSKYFASLPLVEAGKMVEFLGFLQPRRIYLWTCLLVIALVLSPWELISHASASSYPGTVSDEVFLSSHSARNVHGHGHSSHKRFHSDNTLKPRDDYSCSKSNPCSNGACCGAGGYCGYGDTYCGNGCLSNCDAVAECGKDASPKNATCPLNVW